MVQYTDRFHKLTIHSRIIETKQQTLARYRNGLHGDLCKKMLIARLINMEKAYQLALRIEKQFRVLSGNVEIRAYDKLLNLKATITT